MVVNYNHNNQNITNEVLTMPDYQKLYTLMFNAATDALELLEKLNIGAAKDRLQSAQLQAEGLYLAQGGDDASR